MIRAERISLKISKIEMNFFKRRNGMIRAEHISLKISKIEMNFFKRRNGT